MSQIQQPASSQPPPPSVPTNFETQDGTATTSNNILIVNGDDSTENNINGITAKGGVAGTGTANEVDIVLTNRITGSGQTTDDVTPVVLYTFPLGATPGNYNFFIRCTAYDVDDSLGAAYTSFSGIRTTGAAGVVLGANVGMVTEEGALEDAVLTNQVTGNNYELVVTGLAGKTINYVALTEYIFVS